MQRIGLAFLFLAALNAVLGVSLGVVMGILHDFTYAPVHAHLNLVGWASMALFGISYRVWPELGQTRLARLHFTLAAPAGTLFPIGIFLGMTFQFATLAIVAAFAWLIGALLFAIGIGRLLFARAADTGALSAPVR